MKRICRYLILMTIMTLTSITASADKYDRAWKQVDKDIAQDLPESAAEKVNDIFDMAARDHDSKQLLKSAVYISQIEAMMVGDNLTSSIELFQGLMPKLGQKEYKAICHAFLAKAYLQYWNGHRYRIQYNLPQDTPNVPLDKWTASQLCDTVMEHLRLSIDMAGDARSQWFEDFFPGGNKEGMRLRPTLTDLLFDNAVTEISGQRLNKAKRSLLEDRRLYGSARDFVAATDGISSNDADLWSLYVLNRMTSRHLDSKADLRSTIDSRRMDVLAQLLDSNGRNEWSETDSIWVDGMIRLAESYGKKVSFAGIFLSKAAQKIWDDRFSMTDEQEIRNVSLARDLCRRAMKVWPKSEGAYNCTGILNDIESKDVELFLHGDLMAGGANLAHFKYRNVGTVHFRAIEVAGELKDMNTTSVLDQLARCQVASEWKNVMGATSDYVSHAGVTRIPPLMQGAYYIVASTGSNFGARDVISYAFCQCRALEFVQMGDGKGSIEGYFINTVTGKPVPDVKYTLWQTDNRENQVKIATFGDGDPDGHILIHGLKSGSYSFEMSHGTDMGNTPVNVGYVGDVPQQGVVRLYSDRYSYRPGDSVRFAALYYSSEGFRAGKVMKGVPVEIRFMNASGKHISTLDLVTDSMGMATGSLHIPADAMPGQFHISAAAGEKGDQVRSSRSVNVENLSLPKFEVEFDPFDQLRFFDKEITVSGRVMTQTGLPVGGAQVQWSLDMDGNNVDIFRVRASNGRIRIAGGQVISGNDGRFSMSFIVSEDMTYGNGEPVSLTVPVQVTDLNGETRQNTIYMMLGRPYRNIVPSPLNSELYPDEGDSISVRLTDGGKSVKGEVRVQVWTLENIASGIDPGIQGSFNGIDSEKRFREELAASVDKQELAGQFPRYNLDFEAQPETAQKVLDRTVTVGRTAGTVGLKLDRSGRYRISMTSEHAHDYIYDSDFMLESDREWVPQNGLMWAAQESDVVKVGDTAVIRLGNCWPGSVILWSVIDRLGMNRYGTMVSDGCQTVLEIPVTTSLEGGFCVYLYSMLDNITESRCLYFDVPYASHSLVGEVENAGDNVKPGDSMDWKFSIRDNDGNPVHARLLVDMYDSSLDVFGSNQWTFQPWGRYYPHVAYQWIRYRYSTIYDPRYWNAGSKVKPYSGKVALTGVLLDPLNIVMGNGSMPMALRENGAIMTKSTGLARAVAKSSDMASGYSADNVIELKEEEPVMLADVSIIEVPAEGETVKMENLRSDLDPTGLFISLDTDSDGIAAVSFPAPELLTKWHVQAFAYTDSLSTVDFRFDRTTRKELMIEQAAPRFVRQGDRLEFTFKIMNATDSDIDVKARLDLTDPASGKAVKAIQGGVASASKTVGVPAGGSTMASFTVLVPADGTEALEYTLSAIGGGLEDAVRQTIPVLSTRTLVTKSISLFNNGNETRSFRFTELEKPLSGKTGDERVVLEYSSTPMWYAIQSLPALIKADDPSSIRLVHSIFGAASAREIMNRHPEVREQVEKWAAIPAGQWQTRLEQNEDLAAVMIGETPWYRQTQNEKDRLRALGQALDSEKLGEELAKAVEKLIDMRSVGGWPWMEGMSADIHSTLTVLDCLGRLRENGAIEFDNRLTNCVSEALTWTDSYFDRFYSDREKPQELGALELSYLLVINRFNDIMYFGKRTDIHKFYRDLAAKQDTRNLGLMERAQLSLLLSEMDGAQAEHVVQTMLERSVLEDEMGRYWWDNKSGYRWQDAPIESQSLAIEALLATGHDREAGECARWLLKQRQTGDWGTSPATTHAVVALLAAAGGKVQTGKDVIVSLGQKRYEAAKNSDLNGYMKVEIPGRATASMANVKVESKSDAVSWGAVYYQYTDELSAVEASANGLTLERSMWRVDRGADTDRLQDIAAGAALQVGDRVRIRLRVTADRAMEYVQLRDMWAAGFEPSDTRAGRTYGLPYTAYKAPGNSCTDFYFDRLEKGTFEIEYDMFVQKPGTFQAGRATIQCLYSPDMRSGTAAQTVTVDK